MKNREDWKATKFVYKNGCLRASSDARELSAGSRLVAELVARWYGENIPEQVAGRLLDLGCGKVPFYGAYRRYAADNTCVDWSHSLHGVDHIDIECDLNGALPLEDKAYDCVILSDVLEHIYSPQTLCSEIARVLTDGGRLLMNVPFYYWLHEQPHDYYRYTEFALRRIVSEAGLEIVKLERLGGAPEIIADVLGKLLQAIPVVGKVLAASLQALALLLVRSSFGRKLSAKTAKQFPFGYALVARKPGARCLAA